ncbi:MAG TPA: biotin/lipoyl-containing protein [Candidatus Binataceae bacterium]|nr:biotin/lipoyl-containing protein [Candidatus Binataceae bacterium]
MKLRRQGDKREFEVELLARDRPADAPAGAARTISISIDGREVAASIAPMPDGSAMVELGGRRIRVAGARLRASIAAAAGPFAAEFVIVEGRATSRAGGLAAPEVDAPMPCKVLKVLVAEGQPVEHGDPLIVLEAMKMETTLYAESPAIVAKVCVAPGQMVDHGARLIELSPAAIPARPPESPPRDD